MILRQKSSMDKVEKEQRQAMAGCALTTSAEALLAPIGDSAQASRWGCRSGCCLGGH
jgi:hypothetical protein